MYIPRSGRYGTLLRFLSLPGLRLPSSHRSIRFAGQECTVSAQCGFKDPPANLDLMSSAPQEMTLEQSPTAAHNYRAM